MQQPVLENSSPLRAPEGAPLPKPATAFRWTICALIFFAVTVNYLDRQLFSILVPFFENDLRLGPIDLAIINVSFIMPYGLAMIFVGRYLDKIGIRRGLGGSFLLWNVASILHATVQSFTGFIGLRFMLGLSESGMFPAAVKTMTHWFPVKERSFATGLFNAGSNLGAMLAPLLGVYIAVNFGWRTCFAVTGLVGLSWIVFWNRLYREPAESPQVSESELAYINSDPVEPEEKISYSQLFGMKPLYGLGIAKALTDAPWWVYLTWMPKFLVDQFHVSPGFMALAIPVIFLIADVGSIAGGWLSSKLIHGGMGVGPARKLTMLACAVLVTPVMAVGFLVDHAPILGIPCVYWAVGLVALAAGAHQGWSCNLFTLISDTVPKPAIAMGVGACNGFAMVGVSAMQFFVGRSVQVTSSYTLPFIVAGSLYLIALLVIQLFLPQVKRARTDIYAKIPLVVAGAVLILAGLGFLQYQVNRPTYSSLDDYLAVRATQVKAPAAPQVGPNAKVGWMDARWYLWRPSDGKPKIELVKFDTQGRPFVEAKGAKASHYEGPEADAVAAGFGVSP